MWNVRSIRGEKDELEEEFEKNRTKNTFNLRTKKVKETPFKNE